MSHLGAQRNILSGSRSGRAVVWCFMLLMAAYAGVLSRAAVAQTAQRGNQSFDTVSKNIELKIEKAQGDLSESRLKIERERVPLAKELSSLESELIEVRSQYEKVLRERDSRTLNVTNLKARIKAREEQNKFVGGLLDEYGRNLETRMHIAELKRYAVQMASAKSGIETADDDPQAQLSYRFALLILSLERLEEGLGGTIFSGEAADASGMLHKGKFLLLGPVAYFVSEDGSVQGLAETRLGSNEVAIVPFPEGVTMDLPKIVTDRAGQLPIDVSLGDAIKIAEQKETVADEFRKGGSVMYPLFGLAGVSVLIGLVKWFVLARVRRPSFAQVDEMFGLMEVGRRKDAEAIAEKVGGPVGKMLEAGIKRSDEPRDVLEEILFERIMISKAKLSSWLAFVSITAAAAPLLGLLGTVTGMINTFKLITIFGTGDASTFSSGISEALITTKWGLIVAIPALLLHAFLSRKTRAILDEMEQLAIGFMNRVRPEEETGEDEGAAPRTRGGSTAERRHDTHDQEVAAGVPPTPKPTPLPTPTPNPLPTPLPASRVGSPERQTIRIALPPRVVAPPGASEASPA